MGYMHWASQLTGKAVEDIRHSNLVVGCVDFHTTKNPFNFVQF
jgi:hypothetical protein